MTNKLKYQQIESQQKGIPLFLRSWWLDTVCGKDNWDVIIIEKEHGVQGVMPYYIGNKSKFFKGVKSPLLTPFMGFHLFYPEDLSYRKKLSFEKDAIQELLDKLPKHDFIHLRLNPSYRNILPLQWNKMNISPKVTYQLDLEKKGMWEGLDNSLRREIKKAKNNFTIEENYNGQHLYDMVSESIIRQGGESIAKADLFDKVLQEIKRNGCGKSLLAKNDKGEIVSAGFIVWDENIAYYIARGGTIESMRKGSLAWLTYELILSVPKSVKYFDFVGSDDKNVERFIRNFGAEQVNCLEIKRANSSFFMIVDRLRG